MRFAAPLMAAFGVSLLIASVPAHADSWTPLAQVTCIPEHGYFKLETISLQSSTGVEQTIPADFFRAAELAQQPFTCQFGDQMIALEGKTHSDLRGPCGARAGNLVRVLVDDVPLIPQTSSTSPRVKQGWFELSNCFEMRTRVTVEAAVRGPAGWFRAEICRVLWGEGNEGFLCRKYDKPPNHLEKSVAQ